MKLLKFIGVFLAAAILFGLIIYLPNQEAINTLFSNSNELKGNGDLVQRSTTDKGLINYMKQNPNHVALVSFEADQPDSGIYYQANKKRVMGATANLLLIIEYARQIDNGTLNPNQAVKLKNINVFNLPKYYSSNHQEALKDLKNNGQISKNSTIPLHDLIEMIVKSNDLAASDYLYFLLGPDSVKKIPAILHTPQIEAPIPWSGQAISWKASLYNQKPSTRLSQLKSMSNEAYRKLAIKNAEKLQSNKNFRKKINRVFKKNGLGSLFGLEKEDYLLSPKATPQSMAQLLYKIDKDSLINAHVSKIVKKSLQWAFDSPMLKKQIVYYGGLFDARIGILDGMDIGKLRSNGKTRIQVLYLTNVPVSLWMHLSSNFMSQTIQREMIWKPSFYRYAYDKLMK